MSTFQTRPDIEAFRVYKATHLATFLSEIELIVKAGDWRMFRSYFTYTKSPEERALKSILWCRFILPQYFRDPSPDFQFEIAFLFWTEGNEYVACPRGFGKTSTVQGLIAFSIAHKIDNFIVLIEKTHTEASEVLSAIRAEFVENEVLKAIYGNVIGRDKMGAAPEKVKDAEGDMFLNGIRLRAKGFDTPIRGLKSREWRPDRVVCDDVESDEHIRSEDQRRKYKENYTQGIIPAIDIGGKVKVFGTILMGSSLLDDLINTHHGMVYAAFNPSFNIESDRELIEKSLLWPERWSYDRLKQKYDEMKMEGLGNNKFCNPYEAPILMSDWTMKPIGEIEPGDEIVGFTVGDTVKKQSRLVKSKVLKIFKRRARTVNLNLENGQMIRCTPEHKWFTGYCYKKRRSVYLPAIVGRQLMKVIDTPKEQSLDRQLDFNYLAGMIDGEGACKYGAIQISQSPLKNPEVYENIKKVLIRLGIDFEIRGPYETKRAASFVLGGGREMKASLIWYCRDMAKKFQIVKTIWGQAAKPIKQRVRVIDIQPALEEDVYALETETGNYIVWGFMSSNSQEFLNQALAEESRPFKWEWLQRTFSEKEIQYKTFNRCAVIDTAESKNQGADDSFLTVVDWDAENNWFIQEARARKVNAPELIDWIFEIWETWKPQKIGIEKKAFEDQVKPYLRLKSEQLGVYPIVVELEHGGRRKEDRVIGALQGRFESGKIYFKEAPTDDTPKLRGQLHDFPKGRNDDGPDSLAYHASIGSRPFSKAKEVMTGTEREFYEYRKQQKSFNKQSIVNKL